MQKTVLFGKNHPNQQNTGPSPTHCPNCTRLQSQLLDLNQLLAQRESLIESVNAGSESEAVRQLQAELVSMKEKYITLKKKVKQVEKESEELFVDNITLEKQLTTCRMQVRQLEQREKVDNTEAGINVILEAEKGQNLSESRYKKLQIQTFVWKQKAQKLQILLRSQGDEVVRLKQLLKRRSRLQQQRHQLLQLFV